MRTRNCWRFGAALIAATLLTVGCAAPSPAPTVQPQPSDSAPDSTETTLEVVDILIAARDIRAGMRVQEEDVTSAGWPMLDGMELPDGALVVSDESGGIEQAVGRIAKVVIIKGTPILNDMLTAGTEPEP